MKGIQQGYKYQATERVLKNLGLGGVIDAAKEKIQGLMPNDQSKEEAKEGKTTTLKAADLSKTKSTSVPKNPRAVAAADAQTARNIAATRNRFTSGRAFRR